MTDTSRLPLHVVTGFLGAGKTSLINRLPRAPELRRTLVVTLPSKPGNRVADKYNASFEQLYDTRADFPDSGAPRPSHCSR